MLSANLDLNGKKLINDIENYKKYLPMESVLFLDLYSKHFNITIKDDK